MSHTRSVRVAVVTGQHAYDVPRFQALLRSLPGVDAYPQHMEDFAASAGAVRSWYDAVLFYHFHQVTPSAEQGGAGKAMAEALAQLGQGEQGIVVLHHALLAFRDWPLWSEIVGISERGFGYHVNQTVRTEIAAADHPIAAGLEPWEMVDETYTMSDAGAGNDVLLTTEHPQSMRTLAWARRHARARVFCYASGHDDQTYANPSFRTILARGILWAAGSI